MTLRIIGIGKVRRGLSIKRRVDTDCGFHYAYDPAGFEEGSVELLADVEAIVQELGAKALGNKSGKTKYMRGNIQARVIGRRKVE